MATVMEMSVDCMRGWVDYFFLKGSLVRESRGVVDDTLLLLLLFYANDCGGMLTCVVFTIADFFYVFSQRSGYVLLFLITLSEVKLSIPFANFIIGLCVRFWWTFTIGIFSGSSKGVMMISYLPLTSGFSIDFFIELFTDPLWSE